MALPRYKPSEVRNVTAQGSAIASEAKERTYAQLTDTLNQWKGVLTQDMEAQVAHDAEQQAYKDAEEGKPFHQEKVYTVYGKAYNQTRKATYTAQTELDLMKKSDELAIQFENDPEGYKNYFEQYIKTTKDETGLPDVAMAVSLSGTKMLESTYGKLSANARKKEKETALSTFNLYAKQQQSALINAILSGDTKEATLIREGLDEYTTSLLEDGTLTEKGFLDSYSTFEYGIANGVIKGRVENLLEEGKIKEAQELYEDFAKEIPENFTQPQHENTKGALATAINGKIKQGKKQTKELKVSANNKLQDYIDILNAGKQPDFEIQQSDIILADESKVEKYNLAVKAFNEVSKIGSLSLAKQEEKVNEYKKNPKASKLDIKVVKQMEKSIKDTKAQWEKDPITQGVVKLGNEDFSIDFFNGDVQSITDKLKKRDVQSSINMDEAGEGAWQILKETEADDLANFLKNPQSPIQKKQELLEIFNSLGEDVADKVYRQVGGKKAHTFSYAGRLSSYGNKNAALIALQGTGADVKLEEETKKSIQTKLSGVFKFSTPEEYNTMLQGTLDYIKGKTFTDPSYSLDIDEALEETIGKHEKYNGGNVILPYGVETKQFENWLDNIEIADMPQLQEDLRDMTDFFEWTDVQLHRIGNGKYRVFYNNGDKGFYVRKSNDPENPDYNKPFVLEYK